MKILDLGCGDKKAKGAIGVDRVNLPGVDLVHDLEVFPYPFEGNSFDRIILKHVVEHIGDVIGLMEEIHRIANPRALVEIVTPHFTSLNSYNDPTHRHHFSLFAFDFFCGGTVHEYLVKKRFRSLKRSVEFWPIHDRLNWNPYHWMGLRWFVVHHPHFYERFLAFLFPLKEFTVWLEVEKSEVLFPK